MDEKQSIREWYISAFSDDEMGIDIDPDITFLSLFETMDRYQNVYDHLGVYDSIVRERVFDKLSSVMNVSYDYIYMQWLRGR